MVVSMSRMLHGLSRRPWILSTQARGNIVALDGATKAAPRSGESPPQIMIAIELICCVKMDGCYDVAIMYCKDVEEGVATTQEDETMEGRDVAAGAH